MNIYNLKKQSMKQKSTHIFITDSDYCCDNKAFNYLLWFQPSLGSIVLKQNEIFIILDSRYFNKTKDIDKNNIRSILWNDKSKISYIESRNFIDEIIKIVKNEKNISAEWNIAWIYIKQIEEKIGKKIDFLQLWHFNQKRIFKNELEINNLKKAIEIIDNTFIHIQNLNQNEKLNWKTELEVRSIIINQIFENGWSWESFDSIVAFWANSATPHHNTWETIIWDWPLLIDMWALYKWYCSDFTRTFWVWKKKWEKYEEFIKIYNIVKNAHNNAYENTKENTTWKQIDSLTREYIEEKWYAECYTHGTWHGVGLDIHEAPSISKNSNDIIKNNMFFTIEPWIYKIWEFWVRLEDIVHMKNWILKKYTKVSL